MSQSQFSSEAFSRVPIVGIVRGLTFDEVKGILPVYADAGLTTIEITLNTPSAKEMIRYAVDNYGDRLNIGAGTVCDMDDLQEALSAGAQFIVSPVIEEEVIAECVRAGIPVFPGAFTPTEIYRAWKLGAYMVKVYPTTFVGAAYIKDIKAPLNKIKLMPTGGITLENLTDFITSGSDGFGMGSQLFDKTCIQNKDWPGLKKHFERFADHF